MKIFSGLVAAILLSDVVQSEKPSIFCVIYTTGSAHGTRVSFRRKSIFVSGIPRQQAQYSMPGFSNHTISQAHRAFQNSLNLIIRMKSIPVRDQLTPFKVHGQYSGWDRRRYEVGRQILVRWFLAESGSCSGRRLNDQLTLLCFFMTAISVGNSPPNLGQEVRR